MPTWFFAVSKWNWNNIFYYFFRWEYGLIPLPDWNNTVIPLPDWNKASVHVGQENMTVNFINGLFLHFNLDIGSGKGSAGAFNLLFLVMYRVTSLAASLTALDWMTKWSAASFPMVSFWGGLAMRVFWDGSWGSLLCCWSQCRGSWCVSSRNWMPPERWSIVWMEHEV